MYKVSTLINESSLNSLNRQLLEMEKNNGRRFELVKTDHQFQLLNLTDCDFCIVNPRSVQGDLSLFISRLRAQIPDIRIVIFSENSDYSVIKRILKLGVEGYILKSCPVFELAHALHFLASGGMPFSPQVSRFLLQEFQTNSIAHSLSILTRREKQVFECLEEGNSYKGISSRFNISQNTVHSHVKNIYSKLKASNKYDAFVKARELAVA